MTEWLTLACLQVTYALCWTLSVVTALTVVYSVFDWNNRGSYVLAWASTYAALHRLAWGLAVCWVVFVCATGQAALVNRLLSLDLFVPLSRLTYCGYLAQMLIISTRLVTQRHSVYYTHWLLVRDYLGHTVLIYMFAYLMYLLCECPTVKLSKMALNALTLAVSRGTSKDSKSSATQNCCRL
ncbi:nose resistant to fluoxetine protein 6-like [Dermacentor silvarum]|uniref:nose resistant to fluoxetine protein 6-like n=1 Tax=Dermacentor silvarum TaxID=543639 RepID=UPI002101BBE0|nr:nose resistant to fluoxetine protein 6-like [Dermacentor silvarum]